MKKALLLLFAAIAAFISLPASAETVLDCTAYTQEVVINTRSGENALPYLYHGGIVYIPLDNYHRALLNIDVTETETGISVSSLPDTGEYAHASNDTTEFDPSAPVYGVEKSIVLNGKEYSDVRVRGSYLSEGGINYYPYPFARFNGVLYMPLTWQYVNDMGWTMLNDGGQIRLYADSRFSTSWSGATAWQHGTEYHLVSGVNCAVLEYSYSRFFGYVHLRLQSGANPSLTEFENSFFYSYIPEDMQINGNELEITGYYCGYRPDYPTSTAPLEIYRLKIDIPTLTLTDTRLVEFNRYNDIYGALEDENGNIDEDVLYTTPTGSYSYFYYDGGHVILNGTMMRSYTSFVYKVIDRDSDGKMMAFGAGSDMYWICAEDLVNYGYNMTVDYENRATYFTRNPEKEITPLGFEGTNEHLPIYESDWKIYIDGVEPRLYYNIGGYTMINSGELGEYEDTELEDGYDVRRVLTPDMVPHEPKIVGYYSVDVFDEPVENLQSQYLTDVMYAFIIPYADGSLYVPKPDTLRQVVEKAHADGAKVHASIGGWSAEGQDVLSNFVTVASDPELTRKFIESCVWMVREYGLDGIEVDWEHPTADTAELYEDFMLAVCSDPRLPSVSAALCGCSVDGTPNSASEAVSDAVTDALDFINVMAYDANNSDHSPYEFSVSSLNYWLNRGVAKEKLILGIPLYARPSYWQYRHLAEAGYDILHSEYADTPYSPSYYNSLDTIKRKTRLAKDIAGGVMFFDVHEDTSDETSAVRAAYEILYNNQ